MFRENRNHYLLSTAATPYTLWPSCIHWPQELSLYIYIYAHIYIYISLSLCLSHASSESKNRLGRCLGTQLSERRSEQASVMATAEIECPPCLSLQCYLPPRLPRSSRNGSGRHSSTIKISNGYTLSAKNCMSVSVAVGVVDLNRRLRGGGDPHPHPPTILLIGILRKNGFIIFCFFWPCPLIFLGELTTKVNFGVWVVEVRNWRFRPVVERDCPSICSVHGWGKGVGSTLAPKSMNAALKIFQDVLRDSDSATEVN